MIIAVDFDGTVVDHRYPEVGKNVPGAVESLKEFVAAGAKLILYTMRSGNTLLDAVKWYEQHGIPLFGVNANPNQKSWTESPKVYAHVYIDDAAFGCPLRENYRAGGRPFVDWSVVHPVVMEMIKEKSKP